MDNFCKLLSEYKNDTITLTDILDITYQDYIAVKLNPRTNQYEKVGTLKGDFAPLQAQNFAKRYKIYFHQPNTESGFSATLFGEKRKQKNAESKLLKELQCYF